jgi:hypothetical protein
MEDTPKRWVEKFLDRLDEALEWQSMGTLAWRFHPDDGWLQIAPCPFEVVGGADDGESVFPFFSLHVTHLIEIFDAMPEMQWNTMNGELSLEGKIGGSDAWVTLQQAPFEDEEPTDVIDPDGGTRRKKPTQE